MSTQTGPPWMRSAGARRGMRYSGSDLRVSDAERHEVADRLSKHFAEGRLDQEEFNERMEQAMSAKTRSDLGGLFYDLPATDDTDHLPVRRPRPGGPLVQRLLLVILLVVIVSTIAHTVVSLYHPWLLIGVLAALWLLSHDHRRRHRW